MSRKGKLNATILSIVLVVSMTAAVTAIGAVGTVGAIHPSDAPDYTEQANFTVQLPYATDHYPGSQNQENGSIEYYSSGADAFAEQDAEEGIFVDWIIIHAEYDGEEWIDYSACDTENTKAFGIDRGNNNSGTNYDEDLVTHRKDGEFRDDGVTVEFYNWEDIPEDPPYIAPEDAIVAAQGAGSAGGPCLTMTDQPGWYRVAGFINGTVADNGPDEQPSESADEIRFQLDSTFVYVCECDSEEEARDKLGPPPNEQGDTQDTPTSEPDETSTPTEEAGGDDGTSDDGQATEGDGGDDGGATETEGSDDGEATDTAGGDDGSGDSIADEGDDGQETPAADGPGFGAVAALVALLASTLLMYRRR